MGQLECFGSRSNKIKVHIEPPYAVEVSLIFKEALEDEQSFFNGTKLWTSVQKEPAEQEQNVKVGKARTFLDAKTKACNEKSEAAFSYQPFWVLTCHRADTVVEMGTIDAKGDVHWNEVNTQAAFGLDGDSMNKEMRAHKRRP